MSLLHKLNRNLELHPTHPLCDALPSFDQLSSFRIRETWRLGKDIIMYPPVQIIPGVVDRRWIRTLKASQGVWHDLLSDSFFVILQVCRCNSLSCPPGQLAPRGASCPGISCPPPWLSSPPGGKLSRPVYLAPRQHK